MKKSILITGADGFIAKNLFAHLSYNQKFDYDVFSAKRGTSDNQLALFINQADIIVHLAGENRPKNDMDFVSGNVDYTKKICNLAQNSKTPIIYASSTQVELDNDYGRSKLAAEQLLKDYSDQTKAMVMITRLSNVFGKWCRPNYNSFIATMCYNIWHDLPVNIDDKNKVLTLLYIDDVVLTILSKVNEVLDHKHHVTQINYFVVEPQYQENLGNIYDQLNAIKAGQENFQITKRAEGLNRALAATFMSYCPKEKLKYKLTEHHDQRGNFYEVLKLGDYGQVSVSTTKPGIVRGNHFHHTKQEKFLVVKGTCCFKFRSLDTGEVITFTTNDQLKEVVEVPLGYTHNFTNIGTDELVVLIWCNETFDKNSPDTYFLEV